MKFNNKKFGRNEFSSNRSLFGQLFRSTRRFFAAAILSQAFRKKSGTNVIITIFGDFLLKNKVMINIFCYFRQYSA
jgi:hypothetical protein